MYCVVCLVFPGVLADLRLYAVLCVVFPGVLADLRLYAACLQQGQGEGDAPIRMLWLALSDFTALSCVCVYVNEF